MEKENYAYPPPIEKSSYWILKLLKDKIFLITPFNFFYLYIKMNRVNKLKIKINKYYRFVIRKILPPFSIFLVVVSANPSGHNTQRPSILVRAPARNKYYQLVTRKYSLRPRFFLVVAWCLLNPVGITRKDQVSFKFLSMSPVIDGTLQWHYTFHPLSLIS